MILPKLVVDGIEVTEFKSFNLTFPGSNQLNKLTVSLTNPDYDNASLFGKDVELYLNAGSMDTVPIFRGVIKTLSPTDTSVSLSCLDVRTFMTGKDARKINVTDSINYDGFSVAQFLRKVITENVNTSKVRIGLDMLRDTDSLISLTGYRGHEAPLGIAVKKLEEIMDTKDMNDPLSYIIDIEEGANNSNIVIKKQKYLSASSSVNLSLNDGIISYSYKRRPIPSQVDIKSKDFIGTISLGSTPHGPYATSISKDFDNPEEARKHAILHLRKQQQEIDEISIKASKGFYASLESIIGINVNKPEIDGNHRLVGKTISYSGNKLDLSFNLNKRPIKVSDYLSAN